MNNEDIELITLYNTLKEEFLYDRENSSFSFNITCCLSRSFKRFIKDSIKSSRTNKKLFANNFDFVREQFEKSSRTILILFANNLEIVRELFFAFLIVPFLLFVFNNLSSLHSSTKYALRVPNNIYFFIIVFAVISSLPFSYKTVTFTGEDKKSNTGTITKDNVIFTITKRNLKEKFSHRLYKDAIITLFSAARWYYKIEFVCDTYNS